MSYVAVPEFVFWFVVVVLALSIISRIMDIHDDRMKKKIEKIKKQEHP